MAKKVPPLFSSLHRKTRIGVKEAADAAGFPITQMRGYFLDGTIPARQAGPGKRWTVAKQDIEAWWQRFHESNAKKV
jgi:hypothetical protein